MSEEQVPVAPDVLARLERTAVELATLAGAEITTSLGQTLSVRYKGGTEEAGFADPVSEVDHNTEVLIRARLNDAFPTHGILGEEMDAKAGESDEFVWAVDPVDGTTNFVNGFPLFAASIGVLYRGRPLVGAIWCSCSHALRPGVYHGTAGACLCRWRAAHPAPQSRRSPTPRRRTSRGRRPWGFGYTENRIGRH